MCLTQNRLKYCEYAYSGYTHKGIHQCLTNNKEGLANCVEHTRQVCLIEVHEVHDKRAAEHRHVQTYAVLPTQEGPVLIRT